MWKLCCGLGFWLVVVVVFSIVLNLIIKLMKRMILWWISMVLRLLLIRRVFFILKVWFLIFMRELISVDFILIIWMLLSYVVVVFCFKFKVVEFWFCLRLVLLDLGFGVFWNLLVFFELIGVLLILIGSLSYCLSFGWCYENFKV